MNSPSSLLSRALILAYGVFSYLAGVASLAYSAGFLSNLVVPKSVDSVPVTPFWQALAVDLSLLTLFAVQHSVMARPAFKRWWTRIVPEPAERSTFVLFSSLALGLLFVLWQPMGGILWQVENPLARVPIVGVCVLGWLLVLGSTCLINHLDLFGLRQVWLQARGIPYTPVEFKTPSLYRYVRHPLYVGLILAFWATPTMTVAHLVFALMTTGYILLGIRLEERDLIDSHPEYAEYRQRVPMLVPRRARPAVPASPR